MRMERCPHCGAENSIKRTTCHQCQGALAAAAQREGTATASSRWEALETQRGRSSRRVMRPAPEQTSLRGETAARPRSLPSRYLPSARRSLGHVRRMSQFFREFCTMTRSGLTVAAASRELVRHGPKQLRAIARQMRDAAESGDSISSVMDRNRHLFYAWHIGLVQAAESGGFLPDAFEQIAHGYEVEWETRGALRLRLFIYMFFGLPAILLVLPVVRFLQQPIPDIDGWTTGYVVRGLLDQFYASSLPVAIGVVAAVLIWQLLGATAWFQAVQQRLVLRLPIVGGLMRSHALDRYLGTLGLMLRGGSPLGEAAEHAAFAAGHAVLTPQLLSIAVGLREGVPLSQSLGGLRLLDADALGLAAAGEASGELPDMLTQAAGYYRRESEGKRRMLLRAAGIAAGVIWLGLAGALFIGGYLAYFDFLFRAGDKLWMEG